MRVSLLAALCSFLGLLHLFVVYPLVLFLAARRRPNTAPGPMGAAAPLSVSLVCVVHNGAELIGNKIENSLALNYPAHRMEILVVSDGSTDATEAVVGSFQDARVRLVALPTWQGKNRAFNRAVPLCTGDVVVVSDADARLEADALLHLTARFHDPSVGGVCGRRVIAEAAGAFSSAQGRYISLDEKIKQWESRLGRLTSNDGKLYGFRRGLFQALDPAVTDDLFVCLTVISSGFRFVYEGGALAHIPMPSRGFRHELVRRRRIVSRSLRGIWLHRRLLNPFRYGFYAFCLFSNKINRRMMPCYLLVLFAATLFLCADNAGWLWLLAPQAMGLLLAGVFPLVRRGRRVPRPVRKFSGIAFYVLLGALGTLLGMLDAVAGKKVVSWSPVKGGGAP